MTNIMVMIFHMEIKTKLDFSSNYCVSILTTFLEIIFPYVGASSDSFHPAYHYGHQTIHSTEDQSEKQMFLRLRKQREILLNHPKRHTSRFNKSPNNKFSFG